MLNVGSLSILCIAGLSSVGATRASAEAMPDATVVETIENVVFGVSELVDEESIDRVMDVHSPMKEGTTDRPALVLLHGNPGDSPYPGGRQHGFRDIAGYFVKRGYVCFVVAWDLRQGHDKAFRPIEMAVGHIRSNAEKYGIARDRIGVLGSSYGSRHACTLATANFVDKTSRVQACVMWAGGMSYPQDCGAEDAPILLTYGTADRWYYQAEGILGNLRRGNVRHAYFELEGGGHCVPMDSVLGFGRKHIQIVEDFLAICLKDARDTCLKMLCVAKEGEGEIAVGESACYGMYPEGTTVTVTASPALDSRFVEWRGDVESGCFTVDVVMDANKKIVAVFAKAGKD